MSKLENYEHTQDPSAQFEILLSQNNEAVTLMLNPHFLQKVKNNSTQFTQIITLNRHRNVLQQIINIALNPIDYSNRNNCVLNKILTHCAIQVLTNLSEDFTQFVFEQNTIKQEQSNQNIVTVPVVHYIFTVTLSEETEETGFANFLKLVTPLLYRRPQKMLQILNGDLLDKLMQYFDNKSICELLTKALEVQAEDNQFYQTLKLSLTHAILQHIAQQHNQNRLLPLFQNLGQFLQGLADKRQDKYQKQKYYNLIKQILAKAGQFQFLINALHTYPENHLLKAQILHCIQIYLLIHLNPKQKQKQNSKISNDSNSEVNRSIKADQKFISNLKEPLQKLGLQPFLSSQRRQIVNYYKLLKNLISLEPQVIPCLLTPQFVIHTFDIMQQDIDNNILHNFQKDVLIQALNNSSQMHLLLKNQVGLQSLLRSHLSNNLSKTSYQIQLFLIGEAVKNKTQELLISSDNWTDIQSTITNKRNFYSTKIIGGTRDLVQNRWEDYQGKNVKDKVIQTYSGKDIFSQSQKKNVASCTPKLDELGGAQVLTEQAEKSQQQQQKNEHYFDFQLPFDSDKEDQKETKKQSSKQQAGQSKKSLVQIVVNSQSQLIDQNLNQAQNAVTQPMQESAAQTQSKEVKAKDNRKVTFQIQKHTQIPEEHKIPDKIQQKISLAEVLSVSQAYSQNCEDQTALQENGSYNKIGMLRGSMVDSQLWMSKSKDEAQPQNLVQFLQFIPEASPSQNLQNNTPQQQPVCSQQ